MDKLAPGYYSLSCGNYFCLSNIPMYVRIVLVIQHSCY